MADLVVIFNEKEAAAVLAAASQIAAAYRDRNLQGLESGDALISGIDKLEEVVLRGGDSKSIHIRVFHDLYCIEHSLW